MMLRIFWIVCIVLLVSGCATQGSFTYDHPAVTSEKGRGARVAAVAPVNDQREGERKIDQIYADNPLADIQTIIKEELVSTGLFESVVAISIDDESSEADILLEPSLLALEWGVPNYDDIVGKALVFSILTGGLGGAVYGSTNTDVYGNSSLHVRVVEKATGKVLIENTYNGHYEDQMTKFECDTPETKATMVGKSLKVALTQLKKDLQKVLEAERKEVSSSLEGCGSVNKLMQEDCLQR